MESDESSIPSPPPPTEPPPQLPLPPVPARPKKSNSQQSPIACLQQNETEDDEVDVDDVEEISQQMTASYSEISFKSAGASPENDDDDIINLDNPIPLVGRILQRPATLIYNNEGEREQQQQPPAPLHPMGPLNLEGTVRKEGNMTHFIAEDLEYKIKLSSPVTKKGDTPPLPGSSSRSGTPSTLYRQLLIPQMNLSDPNLLINDLECEAQKMATSIDNLTENLCGILHSISSITADNVDVYKNAVSKMSDAMDSNIKSMYTMMAKTEEVTQAMKTMQTHAVRIKEIKKLVDLFENYI